LTLLNIIQKDEELSRSVRVLEGNKWIKPFAVVFAHSGDSWFWLAGLILVAIFGEKTWKIWAMILSGSILALAVFVLSLKFMIRRRRPEGEWGQIYRITDPHSFPSGHAARAFSLAILAIGLGPIWLAWMLVFWAPLVGLARVILGVHYLSDVVVGFIIGIIYGLIIILLKPVYLPYIIGILNIFHS
jgi:membrane-associated phospholipid phosphatase